MGRRGALLATTAFVLALAIGSTTSATPEPSADEEMFAISVNRVFNDDFAPAHWDAPLQAVHDSGFSAARSDAFWMWAEPLPPHDGVHSYDWTKLDAEAGALTKHGLRWLPILDYSALWAASDPSNYHSPPTSVDDYAAYAKAFAERYGRGGSRAGPLPVTTYEIWNEPNGPWFWHPTPDAAVYADMYLKARAAIKSVDPDATVVVGGLVADATFVERMYAARPELRGNVDAIGWHAYAPTPAGIFRGVRGLRRTLERLGDANVPINITELGWPTHGTDKDAKPIVVSEDARAASLETTAEALARSDCGVAAVIPYTWTTPEKDTDNEEDWYGIRHPDGSPTPTSDALVRVLERWRSDPPSDSARFRICHPPDADRDGTPDDEDADDDNDGAPDAADAFRLDPRESSDLDRDGLGDSADADDDGDRAPDAADAFPADPREQADTDRDGVGDNADPDDDNDGLPDTRERRLGSSPGDADSDDDGLGDAAERRTSPKRADSDRDGLTDGIELAVVAPVLGTNLRRFRPDRDPGTHTNALKPDSDGDGLRDGVEDRNHNGRRDRGESDPLRRPARKKGHRSHN